MQDDALEGWLRKAAEVHHLSVWLEPRDDAGAAAGATAIAPLLRCTKLQVEYIC